MRIDILTLFPDMLSGLNSSIIGRAVERGIVALGIHDYREFSHDKNRRVDDYSYGGGAGMIISAQPVVDGIRSIPDYDQATKILLTPSGNVFTQQRAFALVEERKNIILICGRYEGIDARLLHYVDEVLSIGDYVLSGGEYAAAVVVDCIVRLVPGVLGNKESRAIESFNDMLLEYPQYTRPRIFEGHSVPDILISGDHEKIRRYRRFKSLEQTYHVRPDLLPQSDLTPEDHKFLEKIKKGTDFND